LLAFLTCLAAPTPAQQPPGQGELERGLRTHPYFAKVELERVERPPFVFLFQRAPKASPTRAAEFVEHVAPALDGTLQVFEERIAVPNGLVRSAGHERFPMLVLSSLGEFEKYLRATKAPWHPDVSVGYDRALGAGVLLDAASGEQRPWPARIRSARHTLLHACQAAWYAGAGAAPFENWVLEGMAEALANTLADPAVLRFDFEALRQLAGDAQDKARSFAHLRTLDELFQVGEPARLDAYLRTHTPRELAPLKVTNNAAAFQRQAALLFAFLWSDENARHRPALVAFLGDTLHGLGNAQKFQDSFQPIGAAELEQGFLAWALREHKKAFPLEKVDAEKAMGALARGEAAGFSAPLPALDLSDAAPEERLALAIYQLTSGAEAEASRTLDALAQAELEAELHERIERERRRLVCWRELRDAHLAQLAASKGTLTFTHEGKAYQARVLSLAGGEVVLEKNRSGQERLASSALDTLALAQEMRPQGTPTDWARLVPYALRGDPRTKKLLKDDQGESGALLRDALEDYPARLRLGQVLARLRALSRAETPRERGEAEGLLAEVRALRVEGADLEVVQRMEPVLLAKARTWLEAEVALLGPEELFGAKVETLANERVCLTYTFDDPRELDDFEAGLYPAVVAETLPPLETADQPFHVEGGELIARGRAGLRTRFELGPPLSVHYRIGYAEADVPGDPVLFFYLGLADDHAEHFVAGINFRTLLIVDAKHIDQVSGKAFPIHMGAVYDLEMRHDGAKVFLRCEDQEVSIAAGERKGGALFLRAHTTHPVRLTELVIEGGLTPATLALLRKARVERELARF
jgi:hypothetical protein